MTSDGEQLDVPSAPKPPQTRLGPPLVIFGGLAVAIFLVLVSTCRGDSELPAVTPTDTATPAATTTTAGAAAGPEVPPIDGCDLLTDDEVEGAMGMLDVSPRGLLTIGGGEACSWIPQIDGEDIEGLTISIGPGRPDDFAPAATLDGVPGRPVEGAGEAAVWFPVGGGGTLSVVADNSLGYVFVRVGLARPDLDDTAMLDAAAALATTALPRFPGAARDTSTPAPVVDLCELVSDGEAERVLLPYRGTHPGTRDEILVTKDFSGMVDLSEPGDVSCEKLILAEIYVVVEPGDPSDFDTGAAMNGVAGEPVPDVGDAAVWFGGVAVQGPFTAPHGNGVLSVAAGDARFRIRLALPDTGEADQLAIAGDLARAALSRIPGVETGGIAVELPEPVDRSSFGYVDDRLARVEAGDWTIGEGLVAMLSVFAGEATPADVLDVDIADESGAAIVALAERYLASDVADPAEEEITRLLDELSPSLEELEASTKGGAPDEEPSPLLASYAAQIQVAQDAFCSKSYGVEAPCVRKETSDELEAKWPGKYSLYRPIAKVAKGWTIDKIDLAVEAMATSAKRYEELAAGRGGMPRVVIVMTGYMGRESWTNAGFRGAVCVVQLNPEVLTLSAAHYRQAIARDMAYCLEGKVFADVTGVVVADGDSTIGSNWWWSDGLAVYLSDVVYPDANREHQKLPGWLADVELTTPLLSRGVMAWILFEHFHPSLGAEGVIDLIRALPGTLGDIGDEWHSFNQELTDAVVPDVSAKLTIPYHPPSTKVEISGTGEETFSAKPLGVGRLDVHVREGQKACLDYLLGDTAEASWRAGPPGPPGGSWTSSLPRELEGESTYLITATSSGEAGSLSDGLLTITVSEVVDSGSDCDEDSTPVAPPPADPTCALCLPSDYIKFPDQLPDFLRQLLGLFD
jgi:hypothetical protein